VEEQLHEFAEADFWLRRGLPRMLLLLLLLLLRGDITGLHSLVTHP
jgi:hypothetical protein